MNPKAYMVTDRYGSEDCSLIVFAETSGKAKSYASETDEFDNDKFTDIRVNRVPQLDRFYKGKPEMDWLDDEDRVAMVRYAHFECSYEFTVTKEDCRTCSAFQWCGRGEEWRENGN